MRHFSGRLVVAALMAVLAVGATGCSGDDGGGMTSSSETTATGEITELEATEFAFEPSEVTVTPGSREFKIVNRGDTEHALEIHTADGEVETERVGAGESATVTAELAKSGSYVFYCPVANHRELGMEGTVNVSEGGGDGASPEQGGDGSGY